MLCRPDRQPTIEKSGFGGTQAACLRKQQAGLTGGDAYWVRACGVSPFFVRRDTLYFQTPKRSGACRRQAVFIIRNVGSVQCRPAAIRWECDE